MHVSLLIAGIVGWGGILFLVSLWASYFEYVPLAEALLLLAHVNFLVGLLVNVVWTVATVLTTEHKQTGKR